MRAQKYQVSLPFLKTYVKGTSAGLKISLYVLIHIKIIP